MFRKTAQTVFGKSTESVIDKHYNTREVKQSPGPGYYNRFSDFSGLKNDLAKSKWVSLALTIVNEIDRKLCIPNSF